MTLDEQIAKLKYWLGPSTLRNTWTMRDDVGKTIFHIFRNQHFKFVAGKALKNGFPLEILGSQQFALHWAPCINCGFLGDAHTAERKCLYGSTTVRDVGNPRITDK